MKITQSRCPSILVINKIDTVAKEQLAVIAAYSQLCDFDAVIPISAVKRDGTEELMRKLEEFAKPGPKLFPEDMVTDQPEKQVCAEIVREKILYCPDKEIPHGTAVAVTKFSEREDTEIIDLDVSIYCEKDSHKGIIIGKNGEMLKKIGCWPAQTLKGSWALRCFFRPGSRSRTIGATGTVSSKLRLYGLEAYFQI